MEMLWSTVDKELHEKMKESAKKKGFIKPSGDPNISQYIRALVREDVKNEND